MSESASPESGALSFEQAIAQLTPPEPVEQEAPEAPVEAASEPEENTEGETSAPEEAADGDETPTEEAEAEVEPEAVAPVEPPKYWSQDAKAKFAELPPELQAVVLQQEGPREEAAAKAKAEAAEISQKAQAEIAKVAQLSEILGERVGQWVETFKSRWGTQTPDWNAYASENGVEAMVLLKTQYETEQAQLSEAIQAKTVAETQAHEAFLKAEFARLSEIAPDLADPVAGPAKRTEISEFLVKAGIPKEALTKISAVEMAIARDAKLWREAQAKLSATPKPKPAAPIVKSPVRPAASAPQLSPKLKSVATAERRFAQTGSVDDLVAYLELKG